MSIYRRLVNMILSGVPVEVQWKEIYYPWGCRFDLWPHSVVQGAGTVVSCGVVCRQSSDVAWLWLWHRLAAVAPSRSLTWEPPYTTPAALKSERKKKKEKKRKEKDTFIQYNKILSLKRMNWALHWSKTSSKFPLWLSGNKPDYHPWGCGFDPGLAQWVKDLELPWAVV